MAMWRVELVAFLDENNIVDYFQKVRSVAAKTADTTVEQQPGSSVCSSSEPIMEEPVLSAVPTAQLEVLSRPDPNAVFGPSGTQSRSELDFDITGQGPSRSAHSQFYLKL